MPRLAALGAGCPNRSIRMTPTVDTEPKGSGTRIARYVAKVTECGYPLPSELLRTLVPSVAASTSVCGAMCRPIPIQLHEPAAVH